IIQISHKFSRHSDAQFFKALHQRVNDYFKTNNKSKFGGSRIIIKTIVMLAVFFVPFALLFTGFISNPWLIIGLWALMGLGIAGIGVNVMHDANHGVYS